MFKGVYGSNHHYIIIINISISPPLFIYIYLKVYKEHKPRVITGYTYRGCRTRTNAWTNSWDSFG
jgi:hypothetical protein